jgi:hypothetical protein
MATKTYRWLRYFAINGLFVTCIYFGLFMGVEGAANVALFMGWVTGIMGTILMLAIAVDSRPSAEGDLIESLSRQDPSPIPFWFDLMFDLCVVFAFVWTGHYILTFFYVISISAGKTMRDIPKNVMLRKLRSQQ